MKTSFLAKIYFSAIVNIILSMFVSVSAKEEINIITSFASETTVTFKTAFENKYPDIIVNIYKKKTNSGIKLIEKNQNNNTTDIFWASSPDAFEVLKEKGLLLQYKKKIPDIPKKLGLLPINDPSDFYKGFAVSGYGLIENTYYTKSLSLPPAKEWNDLKNPIYKNHIGMSSASRSGTTHLTVETVLQAKGWDKGWETWKEIAGNIKVITANSFAVPDGVNKGKFGIGIVIDYYALSLRALGFPISFTYPSLTTLVPASIAIIKDAPNKKAAKTFIDFILSDTGQKILLEDKICRLPVKPRVYIDTDKNFPNPFIDKTLGAKVKFDIKLSKNRYNVVNALFDVMITYNLDELKTAIHAIHTAEKFIKEDSNPQAKRLLQQARTLVAWTPVDSKKAAETNFNAIFTISRKKKSTPVFGRQAEIEKKWDLQIKENYAKAAQLAEESRWIQ